MYIELKTYQFACDKCGKQEITQSTSPIRPDGWICEEPKNPWVAFGVGAGKDVCPECKDNKRL